MTHEGSPRYLLPSGRSIVAEEPREPKSQFELFMNVFEGAIVSCGDEIPIKRIGDGEAAHALGLTGDQAHEFLLGARRAGVIRFFLPDTKPASWSIDKDTLRAMAALAFVINGGLTTLSWPELALEAKRLLSASGKSLVADKIHIPQDSLTADDGHLTGKADYSEVGDDEMRRYLEDAEKRFIQAVAWPILYTDLSIKLFKEFKEITGLNSEEGYELLREARRLNIVPTFQIIGGTRKFDSHKKRYPVKIEEDGVRALIALAKTAKSFFAERKVFSWSLAVEETKRLIGSHPLAQKLNPPDFTEEPKNIEAAKKVTSTAGDNKLFVLDEKEREELGEWDKARIEQFLRNVGNLPISARLEEFSYSRFLVPVSVIKTARFIAAANADKLREFSPDWESLTLGEVYNAVYTCCRYLEKYQDLINMAQLLKAIKRAKGLEK